MKGVLILGGRLAGRVTAYRAATAQQATIMTGQVSGLKAGQTIQIVGDKFRVVGTGPGLSQIVIELAAREVSVMPALPEPPRNKPAFGSDRPYLKKKKGRS
ncbi:hypothetical protein GJ699_02270 [Duganella sp. FT80W]|uniref:Uncharacterized protein n=1 Tax=Duganella guangzhouensis TaxID=2666084 RepID=A0A6I2KX59_9BURK|nr:hypothetical protein [Duganella guangzhouensis]MRW88806.1 hypothetical protein [Duganella guangzhouensis]